MTKNHHFHSVGIPREWQMTDDEWRMMDIGRWATDNGPQMTDDGGKGPSEKKKEKKKKRKLITDHTCFIPCVVEVIKYP